MKITRKEEPQLFEDFYELVVEDIVIEELKYGEEMVKSIIEFKAEYMNDFYSEVKDYPKYVGLWQTNVYKNVDGDFEEDDIHTLTRVVAIQEEQIRIITTYEPI